MFNIVGKKYRCKTPLDITTEGDYRNKQQTHKGFYSIYLFDKHNLFIASLRIEHLAKVGDFGSGNLEARRIGDENIKKLFKDGVHPAASSYEVCEDNTIIVSKRNRTLFKGKILLNGDAIRGVFYGHNDTITIPSRVYYNVDIPLPNPLLLDEIN